MPLLYQKQTLLNIDFSQKYEILFIVKSKKGFNLTPGRIFREGKQQMKIKTTNKCSDKKVIAKKTAKPAAKTAKKAVTFTVHADKGKSVYLAGCFNNWSPTAKKMAYKAKEGIYSATVQLAAGEYQYKFVIDGTWCADPENVNAVKNDQGTFNSLVSVK